MKKGEKIRAEKPKQYQQGWTEFYKLKFLISEDTLIPRPETELLVDDVINIANGLLQMADSQKQKTISHPPSTIRIIDIGTGSGIIAISIAKNLPEAKIIATDISEKALEIAKKNIKLHYLDDRIIIVTTDLLEHFKKAPDIIVTNLPYIPTARLLHIDPMVTDWEPKIALDGGIDGFELYRKLFTQIKNNNLYPKYLLGEIDHTQAELVFQESRRLFPDAVVEIKNDLAKMHRYFIIKF